MKENGWKERYLCSEMVLVHVSLLETSKDKLGTTFASLREGLVIIFSAERRAFLRPGNFRDESGKGLSGVWH